MKHFYIKKIKKLLYTPFFQVKKYPRDWSLDSYYNMEKYYAIVIYGKILQ